MKLKDLFEVMDEGIELYLYTKDDTISDGARYCWNKKFYEPYEECKIIGIEVYDYREMGVVIEYEKDGR